MLAVAHLGVRAALRSALEGSREVAVVGEADDQRDAVLVSRRERPAVLVFDTALLESGGFAGLTDVVRSAGGAAVVAVGLHDEPAYARAVRNAGASAYVLLDGHLDDVVAAIRGGVPTARPDRA